MTETVVLCGRDGRLGSQQGALRLDVDAPEGSPEHVNLKIDQITRRMVANPPDRLVDLLELAAYIYAADQLVHRGGPAMTGMGRLWRRDFCFSLPVRDIAFWRRRECVRALAETLGFLSDDIYRFRFSPTRKPRPIDSYLDLTGDGAPAGFAADRVALFSGGLDSLAGVAVALLQRDERLAVVSHHASTMVQSRQAELIGDLRARLPPGRIFHVGVRVTRGHEEPREFTQRSRSFLFACLAFVVARLLQKRELVFFENGVVSMNLPIAEHVLGSRATRTTHPRVLADFARLFSLVAGTEIKVSNPYFWFTKAEVLRKLADAGADNLIARSFSCSHVRLAVSRGQQCGACSQCLDRRFAVLAAGLEARDPPEGYAIDLLTGERTAGPDVTLAESYVLAASRYADLSETGFLGRYGEVLRALRHLDGDMADNATRIYELHRRHGRAVRGVIDDADPDDIAGSAQFAAQDQPIDAAVVFVRVAGKGLVDPTEREPPIAEQAAAMSLPEPVARPIVLRLDHADNRVVLASKVIITGKAYRLISKLVDFRLEDHLAHRQQDVFAFTRADALAEALSITQETLRRQVSRLREEVRQEFLSQFNSVVADDDIVENHAWSGYRLNPYLALQGAAADASPAAA